MTDRELLELAGAHLDRLITLCTLNNITDGEVDLADELSEQIWQHLKDPK